MKLQALSLWISRKSAISHHYRILSAPVLLILLASSPSIAQSSLGTSLLGSGGGTAYNGSIGLTFSLGETVIDQTPKATFGLLQNDPQGTPTVAVRELSQDDLVLFPNPNNGEFRLKNIPVNSIHWQVYDLTGRLLETDRLTESTIRLKALLSQGIYLLRLVDEAGTPTGDRKFSIIR